MLPEEKRIHSKQQMKEWIAYELAKHNTTPAKRFFHCGETYVLAKHTVLLRKTEYYVNTGKKIRGLLYRIRLLRFQNKYALHIPVNCCARGLKIMHVGPVLMNGNVSVGEDCSFHINTGVVAGGRNGESPRLGNRVVLGIGAVVMGGIELGDDIFVGANSVVNKDFKTSGCILVGAPARQIEKK